MGTEAHLLNDEFELEVDDGVDLYDDMITSSGPGNRRDSESQDGNSLPASPSPTNHSNSVAANNVNSTGSSTNDSGRDRDGHRDSVLPLRKHQAYVGNLTWWTSDKDIKNMLHEIGVLDFVEVKFYENRANGQSKGYCVLTVASDSSLKLIHDKLPKKEMHGQSPVVTPPTKQALNQFEAQAKTRPSATGGGSSGNQGQGGQGGNMDMNMMGGPRGGPMPMPPQMGMGMGYRGPGPGMMMGPGPRGPRGMGPPGMGPPPPGHPGHRGMGPNMHNPGFGGPPRQMMPPNLPPLSGPPRMPMMHDPFYHQGGPPPMGPRGPMQPMMDPRGPPFPGGPGGPRQDYRPPQMNSYPPHGHPGGPPSQGPGPGPNIRGPIPPQQMQGPPQSAPAPHMNPAFFHPAGPGGPPPVGPYNSNSGPPGGYPPPIEHAPVPVITDAEFEEVMSRNRTVSSSAISRAVSDAATGEFASAIETLVTAISLIKQSKVAHDDRCKILVSSLQDTLHGIEAKSYGRPQPREVISERSRSRERERHRRSRRERTRSREREYRERSRDRYYEYPRERERSRSREYRERPREESSRAYYEERYRERERAGEREREPRSSRTESERPRERDPERERERETVSHRAPRH